MPRDHDAERAVLGAVLIDASRLDDASLPPEAFHRKAHADAWVAVLELSRRGVTPDLLTLKDELTRRGLLEEVGGAAYIASWTSGIPRAANVAHYAGIVRDKWTARRLILAARQIMQSAYEGGQTAPDLVAAAESQILALSADMRPSSTDGDMSTLVNAAMVRYDERAQHPGIVARGCPTGFAALDEMTLGLRRGRLVVVGALTSVGKSAFALNVALAAARAGKTVHLFSLEMDRDDVTDRLVSLASSVPAERLETGFWRETDYKRAAATVGALAQLPITVEDEPAVTPRTIQQIVRARERETGRHTDLVILDYVQLARADERAENRQLEISSISRALKVLTNRKRLDTCVMALAQFNRAVDGRTDKRPRLSDLRESGSLEQDANTAMLLWRPNEEQEDQEKAAIRTIRVDVRKNRGGRQDWFDLAYDGATYTFREPSAPGMAA